MFYKIPLTSILILLFTNLAVAAPAPFLHSVYVNEAEEQDLVSRDAPCASGLHILVARGHTADQQTGGALAGIYSDIINQVPGSDVSQVIYPADGVGLLIPFQAAIGIYNLRKQISDYVGRCPQSKIMLLGYSHGAIVVGDLLLGNGISLNLSPLEDKYIPNIHSVIQVSDPAQRANAFQNHGTGASSPGRVPRISTSRYDKYKGKIASYCQANDFWCASGSTGDSGDIHGNAPVTFRNEIVSWVVGRV